MKKLESSTDYHNNHALGSSLLKRIHSKTLLHALSATVEQTDAMILGSAIHCAILEPERFSNDFVIAPKCDRRTKEGKELWVSFLAASSGKTVLDEDQNAIIKGMKDSLLSHPTASAMLSGGEAEYSYYTQDLESGLNLKCRPDYHNANALIDLKTTQDASFDGFSRQIGNLAYHLQAAFYLDVFNASQGTSYSEFFFIAIENKAPYAVAVYRLDSTHLDYGRIAYRKALTKYAEFLKSGASVEDLKSLRNFGYPTDIMDIQVPYYILDKIQTA